MKEGNRLFLVWLLKGKGKGLVISTQNVCQGAMRLGLKIDLASVVGNYLNCNEIFQVSFTFTDSKCIIIGIMSAEYEYISRIWCRCREWHIHSSKDHNLVSGFNLDGWLSEFVYVSCGRKLLLPTNELYETFPPLWGSLCLRIADVSPCLRFSGASERQSIHLTTLLYRYCPWIANS